jgi:SAM-dependent methyltransferase
MFMKTEISGDIPLKGLVTFQYMLHAIFEICASVIERCPIGSLEVRKIPSSIKTPILGRPSPFRFYQDLACISLLKQYCPKKCVILDIGCGSGNNEYQFRLAGIEGTYLGIDILAHHLWAEKCKNSANSKLVCRFKALSAENMEHLGSFDCVFSSSCLEHISNFYKAIQDIYSITKIGGISFHAVPGPWSYLLYGAHGFRRFSASKIYCVFQHCGFDIYGLVGLGGLPTLLVHLIFITLPSKILKKELREEFPKIYSKCLSIAVKADRFVPRPQLGFVIIAGKKEVPL